jgi:PTH2 family peptidyl-tRNA hydrolase
VTAALASQGSTSFAAWLRDGQPKVVLKVTSAGELAGVISRAQDAGLPVSVVRDAGRTQVAPGTPTCCAVGPAPGASIDAVTGELPLL